MEAGGASSPAPFYTSLLLMSLGYAWIHGLFDSSQALKWSVSSIVKTNITDP